MSWKNDWKLDGSLLFNLVLRLKNDKLPSAEGFGKREKVTNPEILEGMASIFFPNFPRVDKTQTMRANSVGYKNGEISHSKWLFFEKSSFRSQADQLIKLDYKIALNRTISFCHEFFIDQPAEMEQITLFLLECIWQDGSISEDEDLYISRDGAPVKKRLIPNLEEASFQSVLLGCWHYCICHPVKNEIREMLEIIGDTKICLNDLFTFEKREVKPIPVAIMEWKDELVLAQEKADGENNERRFKNCFRPYLARLKEKYSTLTTLLFREKVGFYDVYEPNTLCHKSLTTPRIEDFDDVFIVESKGNNPSEIPLVRIKKPDSKVLRSLLCNHMIIKGVPGIGKSMLAKHILLDAIKEFETEKVAPVFLELKDLDEDVTDFEEFVFDYILRFDDPKDSYISRTDIVDAAARGRIFFIFDGLDEMKKSKRQSFVKWLERFMTKFNDCTVIITSRPDLEGDFREYHSFSHLTVMPFTKEQAISYVKRINYEPETDVSERFLALLNNSLFDTHREYAQNPLLLSILLLTFENFGDVPTRMPAFYQEAYDSLLKKHDISKGLLNREMFTGISRSEFTDLFEKFCELSYRAEVYHFNYGMFSRLLAQAKQSLGIGREANARDFLRDLVEHVGIVYQEGLSYHFVHRSFQEYFCATSLVNYSGEDITAISNQLEQIENRNGGLSLSLFCDLQPQLAEEFVFLPFLKGKISNQGQLVTFEAFLDEMFLSFDTYNGIATTMKWQPIKSNSPIYECIRKIQHFPDVILKDLPIVEDFGTEAFIRVFDQNGEETIESMDYPVLTMDGQEVGVDGLRSEYLVFELIDALEDDDCKTFMEALKTTPLFAEYQNTGLYLQNLIAKYEQR